MAQTSQNVKFHTRFSQKRWHRHLSWSFCCTLHMSRKKVYIYLNSIRKVFKNWFPHLLARSWLWRQLFSIQHWSKKVFKLDFSSFCSHDEKIDGTNISKCEISHSLFAKEVAQTLFLIFLLHASYEQKKGIYINASRKVLKNWFPHLLERSWFWRQLFSIQNSIRKTFKNWMFQLLARSLFWWQLISKQHWIKKIFKNWFPQLLARSWFWRQLFSIQHWMKKVFEMDFSSFCSHDNR